MSNIGKTGEIDPRLHALVARAVSEIRNVARSLQPSVQRVRIVELAKATEAVTSVMSLPAVGRIAKADVLNSGVDGLRETLGHTTKTDERSSGSLAGVRPKMTPIHALLAQTSGVICVVTVIKETSKHFTCHYLNNEKRPFKIHKAATDRRLFLGTAQEAVDWVEREQETGKAAASSMPGPKQIMQGSKEWHRREQTLLQECAQKISSCNSCGSPKLENARCQFCAGFSNEWSVESQQQTR